jgi:hypothetical protein
MLQLEQIFKLIYRFFYSLRTFSLFSFLKKTLYFIFARLSGRPTLYKIQFKSERKEPPRMPDMLHEGTLKVPFSALDEHGLIAQKAGSTQTKRRDDIKKEMPLPDKIPFDLNKQQKNIEEALKKKDIHERMVSMNMADGEDKPVESHPFFDAPGIGHSFSVLGARNGHLHLLAKNALGKTDKVNIHNIFDKEGKLAVSGFTVRLPLNKDDEGNPAFGKVGLMDLSNYIGLNTHTLGALEDAINGEFGKIRNTVLKLEEAEAVRAAIPSTQHVLENIKGMLMTQHGVEERREEKSIYKDRRAGEERRQLDERRFFDRRKGSERRSKREGKIKNFLGVRLEEFRKSKERRDDDRRRAKEKERRHSNDRRADAERRDELNITIERSANIWDSKGLLLAAASDVKRGGTCVKPANIETNVRGDCNALSVHLDHKPKEIFVAGEKGERRQIFITPTLNLPTRLKSYGDTKLYIDQHSIGHYKCSPANEKDDKLTIILPKEELSLLYLKATESGKRKLVIGSLRLDISKRWKHLVLQSSSGEEFNILSKKGLQPFMVPPQKEDAKAADGS